MKLDIQVTRIECKLPNVCVLDIKGEEILRIVGVYASESQDAKKAEVFLTWADANFLAPFTPELSTSLRSNRIIDNALAAGLSIDIHNHSGNTTSDHTSLISVIPTKSAAESELKRFFSSQLSSTLNLRNTSSLAAVLFWSKCKKYLKPLSYTVHAFIAPSGHIIKDTKEMCEVAADFYENCF
ncbi:unnamed protein product [Rotaria sordida]|uniref:Uncharacterized protein n=1 Tax=Rotaria sordida TaxID=392033 RepID=A0A819RFV6_9BILA|nr:unnamed protein product [Rotaria sordida]CAF4047059.1 unnamed protein product [Rotaria sordida]